MKDGDYAYVIPKDSTVIEIRKNLPPTPTPTPVDTTPPTQVKGLTSSVDSNSIVTLNWTKNPESDINRYLVLRDGIQIGYSLATTPMYEIGRASCRERV